jgi:hypothetical protein
MRTINDAVPCTVVLSSQRRVEALNIDYTAYVILQLHLKIIFNKN